MIISLLQIPCQTMFLWCKISKVSDLKPIQRFWGVKESHKKYIYYVYIGNSIKMTKTGVYPWGILWVYLG